MKKIIIIICTIFLIFICYFGYINFFANKYISSEDAKLIATKDVANKSNKYNFNSVEFKETNNTYIYTIIFNDEFNTYTYKINAKNKKIIFSKKESLTNNKIYMNEDDILEIVLKHANISKKECNILSNLIILDEGNTFYNTIFYKDGIRYEYKTDAYTGSIVSITKLNENAE